MKKTDYGKFPGGCAVTDADLERWADQAEAGFPDTELGPVRYGPGRPPLEHPRTQRLQKRVDDETMAAGDQRAQRAQERGTSRSE